MTEKEYIEQKNFGNFLLDKVMNNFNAVLTYLSIEKSLRICAKNSLPGRYK